VINHIYKKEEDSLKKVLIESRYPKLIFAYKKFFSILNKIMKSSHYFDEVLRNDIFTIKDKHNLCEFENVLREVILANK
jgi:hypothetical protein